MNSKLRKIYDAIYTNPVRADILWTDIEALLASMGAELTEGNGSRVRIVLNGERAVFHRPHPAKTTDKGAVKAVRDFLEKAGVQL